MADVEAKKKIILDSIRGVPDFPKPGILFWDVTTIMLNPVAFKHTIDLFYEEYKDKKVDVIAGEPNGSKNTAPYSSWDWPAVWKGLPQQGLQGCSCVEVEPPPCRSTRQPPKLSQPAGSPS